MALSIIQSKVGNPVDNVDTTSLTFDSTTTTGSLLVLTVNGWRANGSGGFLLPDGSVTDNKSNTWLAAARGGVSNGTNGIIFYCQNATGGASHQVTIDPTGTGNYLSWTIYEVGGAATSSVLDQTAAASGTFTSPSTTPPATGNLGGTTSQNDEIQFAVVCQNTTQSSITVGVVSPTYTQVYEQLDNSSHQPGESDYRILSSTTNVGASWSVTATGQWSCATATFKAAAAGGGLPFFMQYGSMTPPIGMAGGL